MSKGNMFVSSAKGRVGNLVLYTRKGSQITRAYQGDVKNPKTQKQMIQRAKFANAVKFYQKAVQHFFKFAYQDQKQNETAFNAFMRHNVDVSCLLKQDEVKDAYFPSLGRWVLSQGTLAAPLITKFSGTSALFANTGISAAVSTVSDLSNVLVGQGFHVGDIVTFVLISSLVTSVDFDLSNYYDSGNLTQPLWDIRQFVVSTSDTTKLSDIPRLGSPVGSLTVVAGGVQFNFTNANYCNAAAVIVTRRGSGITYASNAELVPNSVCLAMIQASQTTSWAAEVAASWRSEGDAILHGSIADGQRATTGTGSSGTGAEGGSSSSGATPSSVITSINNSSSPVEISESGTFPIVIEGTALSSIAPSATGRGISVSDFKVEAGAQKATFNVVVADDYNSGSVSYLGKTVATITLGDFPNEEV